MRRSPAPGHGDMTPIHIAAQLARDVAPLHFGPPISHTYNPLDYAWPSHRQYLDRYARGTREIVLVGMNPGPWGMVQTGVPFGDVAMVRDWLGIEAPIGKPPVEHPKRPILGFACPRGEVSGARLWGWARDRFGTADRFFTRFYVHNYCPLCFMEASGRNFTPDKLSAGAAAPLYACCDQALRALAASMRPHFLIGIGGFAEKRIRAAVPDFNGTIGRVLHPSPASPLANRGWAPAAEAALRGYGILL